MDFGGFILFGLLVLVLLISGSVLLGAFCTRLRRRWHWLAVWCMGFLLVTLFGRHLYQVYWLDEYLFMAAGRGDVAAVKALLSDGASPNATWEDGTSALSVARSRGHNAVVNILEHAGATR